MAETPYSALRAQAASWRESQARQRRDGPPARAAREAERLGKIAPTGPLSTREQRALGYSASWRPSLLNYAAAPPGLTPAQMQAIIENNAPYRPSDGGAAAAAAASGAGAGAGAVGSSHATSTSGTTSNSAAGMGGASGASHAGLMHSRSLPSLDPRAISRMARGRQAGSTGVFVPALLASPVVPRTAAQQAEDRLRPGWVTSEDEDTHRDFREDADDEDDNEDDDDHHRGDGDATAGNGHSHQCRHHRRHEGQQDSSRAGGGQRHRHPVVAVPKRLPVVPALQADTTTAGSPQGSGSLAAGVGSGAMWRVSARGEESESSERAALTLTSARTGVTTSRADSTGRMDEDIRWLGSATSASRPTPTDTPTDTSDDDAGVSGRRAAGSGLGLLSGDGRSGRSVVRTPIFAGHSSTDHGVRQLGTTGGPMTATTTGVPPLPGAGSRVAGSGSLMDLSARTLPAGRLHSAAMGGSGGTPEAGESRFHAETGRPVIAPHGSAQVGSSLGPAPAMPAAGIGLGATAPAGIAGSRARGSQFATERFPDRGAVATPVRRDATAAAEHAAIARRGAADSQVATEGDSAAAGAQGRKRRASFDESMFTNSGITTIPEYGGGGVDEGEDADEGSPPQTGPARSNSPVRSAASPSPAPLLHDKQAREPPAVGMSSMSVNQGRATSAAPLVTNASQLAPRTGPTRVAPERAAAVADSAAEFRPSVARGGARVATAPIAGSLLGGTTTREIVPPPSMVASTDHDRAESKEAIAEAHSGASEEPRFFGSSRDLFSTRPAPVRESIMDSAAEAARQRRDNARQAAELSQLRESLRRANEELARRAAEAAEQRMMIESMRDWVETAPAPGAGLWGAHESGNDGGGPTAPAAAGGHHGDRPSMLSGELYEDARRVAESGPNIKGGASSLQRWKDRNRPVDRAKSLSPGPGHRSGPGSIESGSEHEGYGVPAAVAGSSDALAGLSSAQLVRLSLRGAITGSTTTSSAQRAGRAAPSWAPPPGLQTASLSSSEASAALMPGGAPVQQGKGVYRPAGRTRLSPDPLRTIPAPQDAPSAFVHSRDRERYLTHEVVGLRRELYERTRTIAALRLETQKAVSIAKAAEKDSAASRARTEDLDKEVASLRGQLEKSKADVFVQQRQKERLIRAVRVIARQYHAVGLLRAQALSTVRALIEPPPGVPSDWILRGSLPPPSASGSRGRTPATPGPALAAIATGGHPEGEFFGEEPGALLLSPNSRLPPSRESRSRSASPASSRPSSSGEAALTAADALSAAGIPPSRSMMRMSELQRMGRLPSFSTIPDDEGPGAAATAAAVGATLADASSADQLAMSGGDVPQGLLSPNAQDRAAVAMTVWSSKAAMGGSGKKSRVQPSPKGKARPVFGFDPRGLSAAEVRPMSPHFATPVAADTITAAAADHQHAAPSFSFAAVASAAAVLGPGGLQSLTGGISTGDEDDAFDDRVGTPHRKHERYTDNSAFRDALLVVALENGVWRDRAQALASQIASMRTDVSVARREAAEARKQELTLRQRLTDQERLREQQVAQRRTLLTELTRSSLPGLAQALDSLQVGRIAAVDRLREAAVAAAATAAAPVAGMGAPTDSAEPGHKLDIPSVIPTVDAIERVLDTRAANSAAAVRAGDAQLQDRERNISLADSDDGLPSGRSLGGRRGLHSDIEQVGQDGSQAHMALASGILSPSAITIANAAPRARRLSGSAEGSAGTQLTATVVRGPQPSPSPALGPANEHGDSDDEHANPGEAGRRRRGSVSSWAPPSAREDPTWRAARRGLLELDLEEESIVASARKESDASPARRRGGSMSKPAATNRARMRRRSAMEELTGRSLHDAMAIAQMQSFREVLASCVQEDDPASLLDVVMRLRRCLMLVTLLSHARSLAEATDAVVAEVSFILDTERAALFSFDKDRDELWAQSASTDSKQPVTARAPARTSAAPQHASRGWMKRHGSSVYGSSQDVGAGIMPTEIRFPASRGVAGWVAHHREPLVVPDAYADRRFNPDVDAMTGFRTRNILTVPVLAPDGSAIGVLQAVNKRGAKRFTPLDLVYLGLLASQASGAMMQTRMMAAIASQESIANSVLSTIPSLASPFGAIAAAVPLARTIPADIASSMPAPPASLFMEHPAGLRSLQGVDVALAWVEQTEEAIARMLRTAGCRLLVVDMASGRHEGGFNRSLHDNADMPGRSMIKPGSTRSTGMLASGSTASDTELHVPFSSASTEDSSPDDVATPGGQDVLGGPENPGSAPLPISEGKLWYSSRDLVAESRGLRSIAQVQAAEARREAHAREVAAISAITQGVGLPGLGKSATPSDSPVVAGGSAGVRPSSSGSPTAIAGIMRAAELGAASGPEEADLRLGRWQQSVSQGRRRHARNHAGTSLAGRAAGRLRGGAQVIQRPDSSVWFNASVDCDSGPMHLVVTPCIAPVPEQLSSSLYAHGADDTEDVGDGSSAAIRGVAVTGVLEIPVARADDHTVGIIEALASQLGPLLLSVQALDVLWRRAVANRSRPE